MRRSLFILFFGSSVVCAPAAMATEPPAEINRAERPVPSPSAPPPPTSAPAPVPAADQRAAVVAWLTDLHASNLCLVALANAGRARSKDADVQALAGKVRERRLALDQSLMAVLHELDVPQATLQPAAATVSGCLGDPGQRQLLRQRGPRSTVKMLTALAAHETNDLDRLRAVRSAIEGAASPLAKDLARQSEDAFKQTRSEAERLLRDRSADGAGHPPS